MKGAEPLEVSGEAASKVEKNVNLMQGLTCIVLKYDVRKTGVLRDAHTATTF